MKSIFSLKLQLFLFLSFFFFLSCEKDHVTPTESNPFGDGNGQITFYTKSDLGQGTIKISIDGKFVGNLTHYHTAGVTCGYGDVSKIVTTGVHQWSATSTGGMTWNGTFTTYEGACRTMQLLGSGGGNGGGFANEDDCFKAVFKIVNNNFKYPGIGVKIIMGRGICEDLPEEADGMQFINDTQRWYVEPNTLVQYHAIGETTTGQKIDYYNTFTSGNKGTHMFIVID